MPQDWFDQNAPKADGQDWFEANKAKLSIGPESYAIKPGMPGPLMGGVRQSTMRKATSALPYIGAGAGALIGEGLGSIPGAAIGGAAGESLRQLTNRFFGLKEKETETSMGASEKIGKMGVEQGTIEAATAGIGAAVKPLAGALKESAGTSLGKVLAPTRIADKVATQKILPRMVEEAPIAFTRKGLLESVGNKLTKARGVLDDALDAVPAGKQITPGQHLAVIDGLDDLAKSLMVKDATGAMKTVPGGEGTVEFIGEMKNYVLHADPSFEAMRDLRKILDGLVDKSGKWNMTAAEGSEKEIQRFTANRIREELARAAPDVAAANKDYSFYKGMQTVLEHSTERMTGQKGNLTKRILIGAGIAKGGITGAMVMKGLTELADSTAWQTVSAATKSKIANLIGYDQLGPAMALITRTMQAGVAAHRAGGTEPLPKLNTVNTAP